MPDIWGSGRDRARIKDQLGGGSVRTDPDQTNNIFPVHKFPFDERVKVEEDVEFDVNGALWLKRGWRWRTTEDFKLGTSDGVITENDEIKAV